MKFQNHHSMVYTNRVSAIIPHDTSVPCCFLTSAKYLVFTANRYALILCYHTTVSPRNKGKDHEKILSYIEVLSTLGTVC